ncbi:MAG: two-component sensor histidine kinase, partial [Desulfobacterales bacterium]|nr:two-component sensor histidine kinase [Desulfobacterales bacterium]
MNMNLLKNAGIHQRLLMAAVFLISASTFALGYFGLGMINRFVTLRFEQRMDYMAANLAINAELGILIDEKDLLKGLALGLLNEKDIAAVEIENGAGETLVKEAVNFSPPF